MLRYWELNGKPFTFYSAPKGMFTLEDDGEWHARSVAYNKQIEEYEGMKDITHSTLDKEINEFYYNPDGQEFKKDYIPVTVGDKNWKYINRKNFTNQYDVLLPMIEVKSKSRVRN